MSSLHGLSASRRKFLGTAALVSAAVATGSVFPEETEAAIPASMGKATNFDLGMAPHRDTAGAVIVQSEWGTYVTFPDSIGGTAVVELVGCKACTHSYSTNLGHDGRPYSYFGLKSGAVFEITDSPWLLRTEEDVAFAKAGGAKRGWSSANQKSKPLRHFVFTFYDTTYQCIAEGLQAKLYFGPFGEIAAELMHRGLVD
jgi:hypothetical protein